MREKKLIQLYKLNPILIALLFNLLFFINKEIRISETINIVYFAIVCFFIGTIEFINYFDKKDFLKILIGFLLLLVSNTLFTKDSIGTFMVYLMLTISTVYFSNTTFTKTSFALLLVLSIISVFPYFSVLKGYISSYYRGVRIWNPNTVGQMYFFAFLIASLAVITFNAKRKKILVGIFWIITLISETYLGCGTSIISLIVFGILYFILPIRFLLNSTNALIFFWTFVVVTFIIPLISVFLTSKYNLSSSIWLFSGRYSIWSNMLEQFAQHPLNFFFGFNSEIEPIIAGHNSMLNGFWEIILHTGIIYFIYCVYLWHSCIMKVFYHPLNETQAFLFMCFFAILVNSMMEIVLVNNMFILLSSFFLGLACNYRLWNDEQKPSRFVLRV